MLHDFLRRHDIDILLVQEVTSTEVLHLPGYMTHHNVGASMRGTAFVVKEGFHLDSIVASPTGRAMAAVYHGVLPINVYAPSGTAMRTEREQFFNSELHFFFGLTTNTSSAGVTLIVYFNRLIRRDISIEATL
jgi:exonuclease III